MKYSNIAAFFILTSICEQRHEETKFSVFAKNKDKAHCSTVHADQHFC